MIKKLLSVSMICAATFASAQQLPNSGFENWTNGNPDNWGSIDFVLNGLGLPGTTQETQVTPGHSGNSACQLKTQTVLGVGVTFGIVNSGPISFNGTSLDFGFSAFNQNPTSYDFYYKYSPVSNDTAVTFCYLTKWNTGTNSRDTLGVGGTYILGAQSTFALMNVPITYVAAGSPDSIQLLFVSSAGAAPQANTTLIIDDVNMNLVTGVKEPFMLNTYSVFPNPASDVINIVSKDEKAAKVQIYDVTGRLVTTENFNNKKVILNVESYSSGMYIYKIVDAENNELKTSKFNVSK